ncbi:BAX inhibitor (BI)-1/YccA family protein [Loktanella sp. D2R18]|uniref:Bax inhibitor-1/YccA family protein n=1 Tax=Rhodobacterales TaxID=204455 RepID=UPI000DEAB8A0|nr:MULTISPECIES: Bax inhibitor-1/YccA family protein [Rhodobacterales]MDO6589225.1 Bax inhibitor-1/YccA family protein [Yoonia sp. 1_MG-2023]RBW45349.1 BAX inhibitor (BI)-1/YccA family protein [Loktanella sp. D2R18]
MAEYDWANAGAQTRSNAIDEGLRTHMNKVYATMSIGMVITALAAWAIAGLAVTSDPAGAQVALREGQYLTELGRLIYTTPLRYVIMFAPLAFVFGLSAMINRMSSATAQLVFYAFAAVMGLSLSSIFLVYTGASIVQIFLITAIAFASLSLYGYTTKKDLSGMGTFLMMGLVGLIVAMVVNIFLQSPAIMFAISAIGVLIFAGLTAYDTQKIKTDYIAHAAHGDSEWLAKAAIMGALNLYLDFINMFIFLLQLFGSRE